MIFKNAARMIVLAAFLFAPPSFAQYETVGGYFYADCGPTDGAAVTIVLDNHLNIMVYDTIKPDEAYRTRNEVFEEGQPMMAVNLCDFKMEKCKPVEGVLTMYRADTDNLEGAIELTSPEFLSQGDSESPQGQTHMFKISRDKNRAVPVCAGPRLP